jgi:hypothetical protein
MTVQQPLVGKNSVDTLFPRKGENMPERRFLRDQYRGYITRTISSVVIESVESCSCENWEAGNWGRGEFGNPEEGERPPFEAATKQLLMKTEMTLCVL